ncbi:MAG: EAL domain-containing protein [Nitrospirae bacterium]|nr:MAG: EAL domain-containing protein [Nitrospirota bacterium]
MLDNETIKLLAKFPEESPDPVFAVRKDGTLVYANAASLPVLQSLGCPADLKNPVCDRVFLTDEFSVFSAVEENTRTYSFFRVPVGEDIIFFYGQDVTEKRAVETALRRNQEGLQIAQSIAHIGNWDWNIAEGTLAWSDEIYRIFGLKPQEFGATYEAFLSHVHPDDRETLKNAVNDAISVRSPYEMYHRIIQPDKSERIVHEQGRVIFDKNDKPSRMVGTVQDVTELKRTEREMKKLLSVIEESINVVIITGFDGSIEYVNKMFENVTGYSKAEAMGQNPRILSSGETAPSQYEGLWQTITAGKTWRGIFKNRKKNGEHYWGNGIISPIRDERGNITHFMAIQEDITDKMQVTEQAQYLSLYDKTTGIFNRSHFVGMLDEWLGRPDISSRTATLLLLNVDGFKLVNNTYGHGAGDELLRIVADTLLETVLQLDTLLDNGAKGFVGRLGGDEFAVWLPDRNKKQGLESAEHIRKKIEVSRFLSFSVRITVSVGIVLFPEHGTNTKELLSKANAAINRTREMGQNRLHLYQSEDDYLAKFNTSLEEKANIMSALEENRFLPWFQPILDIKDGTITHYEALARMLDGKGGIIPPSSFIFTAERFGLITHIDKVVTEKTMTLQSIMAKQGKAYSFSMNISGKNIGDRELLKFLVSAIRRTGADPEALVFEITETAAVSDLKSAINFIRALKAMGCCFSLDDFGVGFTSFSYLMEMGVDYIKIDGSFVKDLTGNPKNRLLVRAIADMARGLGIRTVAEFVENKETLDLLGEYKIDYAQGYLIGKPSPTLLD